MESSRADIFKHLQMDILRMQGFKPMYNHALDLELGPISKAFPNQSFPLGAIHEFLSPCAEDAASACGFMSGVLSSIMKNSGAVIWISTSRTLFPPALKTFGIDPDKFIFIDLQKEKDVLWTMEEALKCSVLTAVVGEVANIDLTSSRRLQLAVEQSQVTGFILRKNNKQLNTSVGVSRWRITSLPSAEIDAGMPGVGFPRWKIELLRMRNGKTGIWEMQWINGRFVSSVPSSVNKHILNLPWEEKQAG